jgi:hypothetical protein
MPCAWSRACWPAMRPGPRRVIDMRTTADRRELQLTARCWNGRGVDHALRDGEPWV